METTCLGPWLEDAAQKLAQKMPLAVQAAQGLSFIPYTCEEGIWKEGPADGMCWWTNGFWSAEMWQMYGMTGDELYLREARRAEVLLKQAFLDFPSLHHDVGFMWRISTGFDYDLTQDKAAGKQTLFAANLLAGRYNPNGFIRAWNQDKVGWAIIDCMMNLSLLYWASDYCGDPRFRLIAQQHARTTQNCFIRPSGESEHIVVFNPENGNILDKPGGQGYGAGSVWSRGQGWAIYGFAISARHTGCQDFLSTSRRAADAFIANVWEDWLPRCDFRQPTSPDIRDDCAGVIAASGMLELADLLGDEGAKYRRAAAALVQAALKHHVDWSNRSLTFLTHCTGAYHDVRHHIPMVYGDYYLIECIARLLGRNQLSW